LKTTKRIVVVVEVAVVVVVVVVVAAAAVTMIFCFLYTKLANLLIKIFLAVCWILELRTLNTCITAFFQAEPSVRCFNYLPLFKMFALFISNAAVVD